jgi:hypothetical protein
VQPGRTWRISLLEVGPLARAPEVVDDQEPARLEVAPQAQDLRLGEGHAADLDRIEEREPVQVGIVEADGMLVGRGVQVGQQRRTPIMNWRSALG